MYSKSLVGLGVFAIGYVVAVAVAANITELHDLGAGDGHSIRALEVVDLTKEFPDLDSTHEMRVLSRKQLTIGFLKEETKGGKRIRFFLENEGTYIVPNYLKNEEGGAFEVQEWSFNDAYIVGNEISTILLSPELIHNSKDGSGSVGSSITVEISSKLKFTNKESIKLDIKVSVVSVTFIPGAFIGYVLETAKTVTKSFKYATSMTISSACTSTDGHTVGQYLSVGFDKIENIKVKTFVYNLDKTWIELEEKNLASFVNPSPSVVCITV